MISYLIIHDQMHRSEIIEMWELTHHTLFGDYSLTRERRVSVNLNTQNRVIRLSAVVRWESLAEQFSSDFARNRR